LLLAYFIAGLLFDQSVNRFRTSRWRGDVLMKASGKRCLRILLSEGASTSAREAITALGLAGHWVEVCDPDRACIGRFSRFVKRFHRCPGLGDDPEGYLAFVLDLISRNRFDVLIPIHEQGYLFAKVQQELAPHVAVALPSFKSYERAHSKAGFSEILCELELPQPETAFVKSLAELRKISRFPCVLKAAISTASRGTWIIHDAGELEQALTRIGSKPFDDVFLVQEFIDGPVEHVQAVFDTGRLVGMHAYNQLLRGAGGGPAMKESVSRPEVRSHLARIGAHLGWHGALSVDYVVRPEDDMPLYIDCNPRLVEPVNGLLAGFDLSELLLRVSLGEHPPEAEPGRKGVRTHMALQVLLGCAIRDGSRRDLLRECWRLSFRRGPYAGSREELTPLRWDWPSVAPTIFAALWLLANPRAANRMVAKGWGAQLLSGESIRVIRERIGVKT
jgi:predicted ATP-grasp superfamily ATP-dependent carboligase